MPPQLRTCRHIQCRHELIQVNKGRVWEAKKNEAGVWVLHFYQQKLVKIDRKRKFLATVFLHQEVRMGAKLLLDAGSLSVLGDDRGVPAVRSWNRVP